jgi:hypothetical protein
VRGEAFRERRFFRTHGSVYAFPGRRRDHDVARSDYGNVSDMRPYNQFGIYAVTSTVGPFTDITRNSCYWLYRRAIVDREAAIGGTAIMIVWL